MESGPDEFGRRLLAAKVAEMCCDLHGRNCELYVVMVNDRHTDPTAYVYSTAEAAIAAARAYAESAVHAGCTVDEQTPPDGWLYHAIYCVEGDDVWVVPATLDPAGLDV